MRNTEEDYRGWPLRDRLELLAFDARLAGVPQELLAALWEAIDRLTASGRDPPPRGGGCPRQVPSAAMLWLAADGSELDVTTGEVHLPARRDDDVTREREMIALTRFQAGYRPDIACGKIESSCPAGGHSYLGARPRPRQSAEAIASDTRSSARPERL